MTAFKILLDLAKEKILRRSHGPGPCRGRQVRGRGDPRARLIGLSGPHADPEAQVVRPRTREPGGRNRQGGSLKAQKIIRLPLSSDFCTINMNIYTSIY